MGGSNQRFGIWDIIIVQPSSYCATIQLWILPWSYLFLSVREKDGNVTPSKQTEQMNKESLCHFRPHISTAQKEMLTFITAAELGPMSLFRCHGEKIPYFFLYRSSVTQKMPHKCLSLWCCHFNWISLKVQINLEGASVSGCGCDTQFQPGLSMRLIKSLRVSWGCYLSCLDLLLIDSCFANRNCCMVTGDSFRDLHTHTHFNVH